VGEAKANLEQFRAKMIDEMERWMMPPSDREAQLLKEVEALLFKTIERAPKEMMEWGRMKPQQCHANAFGYCQGDRTGNAKPVSGWWRRHDPMSGTTVYAFHTVVKNFTGMFCLTPYFNEDSLEFAPDPKIEWRVENDFRHHARDGEELPFMVRKNPETVIQEATGVRDRLRSGMNPWNAIKVA
jgi:hypothetical protein